jgi:hypothetical protein|tara:strand:- start:3403 stop:3888 length:486 start_codon:yes stop_codon:yes gene_type:complete
MKRRKPLSPDEFLKYVAKPVSPEEMDIWVKSNNITSEKTNLFFDFICCLYTIMSDTYLGDDVIVTPEDKEGHFTWCWTKNIENFKEENINFEIEGNHYKYLWNFFQESFYGDNENNNNLDKLDFYLTRLFKLYIEKTKSELDILKNLYIVLDKSLIIDNSN